MVNYNNSNTQNIVCNVGDTLKFYGIGPTGYGVSINGTQVISVHPCMTSPYYIGKYVIIGGETSFTINTGVSWSGTITVTNPPVTTGLNELSNIQSVNVFPNPVKDILNVGSENSNVKIFNVIGDLILTERLFNSTQVNVSNLSPGLYMVWVDNRSYKIFKE
eukprot:TRINITY_DN59603_c0_g1_i1.p1 TRINITY_DN59603_c0_g1~~TRINITY_DN59603_c0_g1_i1.p1  ORF type:complete len:185 (+),score=6.50 TRINITY_DN59603_c0_g1_i1:72-557(+)